MSIAEVTPASFSRAALEAIEETGIDFASDLARLRDGSVTAEDLLAECLQGSDGDREEGWRDYVSALESLAQA